jgi:DNA (cytosine-5)-methyltransferase 1
MGGISEGLSEWVRPVAYCEINPHARRILLRRIEKGQLANAPIWDDVRTLPTAELGRVDIVYGGFPCQDISAAGRGAGLAGERSGLFYEITRLCDDLRPRFVFLENVPAITTRGLDAVIGEFTKLGYDCRWTIVSAAELGANHLRRRWFLLAHTNRIGIREQPKCELMRSDSPVTEPNCPQTIISDSADFGLGRRVEFEKCSEGARNVADAQGVGSNKWRFKGGAPAEITKLEFDSENGNAASEGLQDGAIESMGKPGQIEKLERPNWWAIEPDVVRVANGIPDRRHRIEALGNSVVPHCVHVAFKRLAGLT